MLAPRAPLPAAPFRGRSLRSLLLLALGTPFVPTVVKPPALRARVEPPIRRRSPALAFLLFAVCTTVAASVAAAPGTLELKNTRWERVHVEVRVGPSSRCEDNESQGTRALARDDSWAVVSEEVVCWRRERTPGDSTRGWQPWDQTQLAADEVREVRL